jgi:hypothetical protein
MDKSEQLEQLLKQALSSKIEPSEALNQKIINQLKENKNMKPVRNKRMVIALIAAAIILAMSATAFAAWQLLSPKQVAEHLGNNTLANAFDGENAIEINKTITSEGYVFTLLGVTSGENLSEFKSSAQDINPDRTYAVVSIAKQDGSQMPAISDEEYGQNPFIISPLIKGQKPWQVNIFTMHGGYSECVVDGIMYRMIECDSIEMFADRGIYLCISAGNFIDNQTVSYNEKTGEISPNVDFKGASALFDLPLDIKKADHAKAENYLHELLNPKPEATVGNETVSEGTAIELDKEIAEGTVIPDSIKEVTYDENGMACYEYKTSKVKINLDHVFKEGEIGIWKNIGGSGSDDRHIAMQLMKDSDGVVTGRAIDLTGKRKSVPEVAQTSKLEAGQ